MANVATSKLEKKTYGTTMMVNGFCCVILNPQFKITLDR
jgi:hypothetical protein